MNAKYIKSNKSGFTLLEIIIVIIIVGVMASLALPRLFSTVEYSRSTEALSAIASIRSSMERCYLQRSGTYAGCDVFGNLDVTNPATSPGAHFGTYAITSASATDYTITGTRNTVDGGNTAHTVVVAQTGTVISRSGTNAFSGLK